MSASDETIKRARPRSGIDESVDATRGPRIERPAGLPPGIICTAAEVTGRPGAGSEPECGRDMVEGVMTATGWARSRINLQIHDYLFRHGGDIRQEYETRINGLHNGHYQFHIRRQNLAAIIQEIEMNRIDEIAAEPTARVEHKKYSTTIVRMDRPGLCREIDRIFSDYGIEVITRHVQTGTIPSEAGGGTIARIYVKIEVPTREIKNLGAITDSLKELGKGEFCQIDPLEPIDGNRD